ncbi:MAG: hypothetical protein MHM6MM_005758 [Cercozoa sp. M6MM]
MRNFTYSLFWKVRALVNASVENSSLKELETVSKQLNELVEKYGDEGRCFLLRALFEDLSLHAPSKSDHARWHLIGEQLNTLLASQAPNAAAVSSMLCEVLVMQLGLCHGDFLTKLNQAFAVPRRQQLLLADALLVSRDSTAEEEALRWLQLMAARHATVPSDDLSRNACPSWMVHSLRAAVQRASPVRLDDNSKQAISRMLDDAAHLPTNSEKIESLPLEPVSSTTGPNAVLRDLRSLPSAPLPPGAPARAPTQLAPGPVSSQNDTSPTPSMVSSNLASLPLDLAVRRAQRPADVLLDVGYGALASADRFSSLLQHFEGTLDARSVAHMIAMMVRYPCSPELQQSAPETAALLQQLAADGSCEGTDLAFENLLQSIDVADEEAAASEGDSEKDKGPHTWNTNLFVQTVRQRLPHLHWESVWRYLDCDEFFVTSDASLVVLVKLLRYAEPHEPVLNTLLFREWRNVRGHFSLLQAAIKWPQLFKHAARRQSPVILAEKNEHHFSKSVWCCVDLVETLLRLSNTALLPNVRALLQVPMEQCPELLLCSVIEASTSLVGGGSSATNQPSSTVMSLAAPSLAASMSAPVASSPRAPALDSPDRCLARCQLRDELLAQLMPRFLQPKVRAPSDSDGAEQQLVRRYNVHANCRVVLERVWVLEHSLVHEWFLRFYLADRCMLPVLLELMHTYSGAVELFTTRRPWYFAIDVATLASRQKLVRLEDWVTQRAIADGTPFVASLLKFLADNALRYQEMLAREHELGTTTAQVLQGIVANAKRNARSRRSGRSSGGKDGEGSMSAQYCNLLSLESVAELLRGLQAAGEAVTMSLRNDVQRLLHAYSQANESLERLVLPPRATDDLVQSLFHELFSGILSPENLVRKVSDLRVQQRGDDDDDSDVFARFTHALIDEWRFMHKYPVRELELAATVVGQLINLGSLGPHSLKFWLLEFYTQLSHVPAGDGGDEHAEAAAETGKPMSEARKHAKRCRFARVALLQLQKGFFEGMGNFLGKLALCDGVLCDEALVQHLMPFWQMAGLDTTAEQRLATLPARIEAAKDEQAAAAAVSPEQQAAQVSAQTPAQPAAASKPQVDKSITDKCTFILNFVTKDRAKEEAEKLLKCVPREAWWHLAELVVSRVTRSTDKHEVYYTLLKYMVESEARAAASDAERRGETPAHKARLKARVEQHELWRLVLKCAYGEAKSLLRSVSLEAAGTQAMADVGDAVLRKRLQAVGAWLGRLTLGRSQPLLLREVDMERLIVDAFMDGLFAKQKGVTHGGEQTRQHGLRQGAVVMFVCAVLQHANSRVFAPPNPWTTKQLGLLAELLLHGHRTESFVEYEIESLFKKVFGRHVKEVPPSTTLRALQAKHEEPRGRSMPDYQAQAQHAPQIRHGFMRQQQQMQAPRAPVPPQVGSAPQAQQPPNIRQFVHVNPNIPLLREHEQLRALVPVCIDRSIADIIQPVVDRSCHIACLATRDLVTKDLVFDKDAEKVRHAGVQTVKTLSTSLAMVTCMEPLKLAISKHLGSMFREASNNEAAIKEAIDIITADNVEIGCAYIEKHASDRATKEIERILGSQLYQRRQFVSQHGGTLQHAYASRVPFIPSDPPHIQNHVQVVRQLPPSLCADMHRGITDEQFGIYAEFQVLRQNRREYLMRVFARNQPQANAAPVSSPEAAAMQQQQAQAQPQGMPKGHPVNAFLHALNGRWNQLMKVIPAEQHKEHVNMLSQARQLFVDTLNNVRQTMQQAQAQAKQQLQQQKQPVGAAGAPGEVVLPRAVSMLPPKSPILQRLQHLKQSVAAIVGKDALIVLLLLANDVLRQLFTAATSMLALDVCLKALRFMCAAQQGRYESQVMTEITELLQRAPIDMLLNADITSGFLREGLVVLHAMDTHLAGLAARDLRAARMCATVVRIIVLKEHFVPAHALGQVINAIAELMNNTAWRERLLRHSDEAYGRSLLEEFDAVARLQPQVAASRAAAQQGRPMHPHKQVLIPAQQVTQGVVSPQPSPVAHGAAMPQQSQPQHASPPSGATPHQSQLQLPASYMNVDNTMLHTCRSVLDLWRRCLQKHGYVPDLAYQELLDENAVTSTLLLTDQCVRFIVGLLSVAFDACRRLSGQLPKESNQKDVIDSMLPACEVASLLCMFVKRLHPHNKSTNMRFGIFRIIMSALVSTVLKDARVFVGAFDQRAYLRVFSDVFQGLNSPDPRTDTMHVNMLKYEGHALHLLRPEIVPEFAFAWLTLVSHRMFMPRLLLARSQHMHVAELQQPQAQQPSQVQQAQVQRVIYPPPPQCQNVLIHTHTTHT